MIDILSCLYGDTDKTIDTDRQIERYREESNKRDRKIEKREREGQRKIAKVRKMSKNV